MVAEQRVLVVVDPTASFHPAIERAAWLARSAPSVLELFICDYASQLADARGSGSAGRSRRRAPALLAQAQGAARATGRTARGQGAQGRRRQSLGLSAARRHRPQGGRLRRRLRRQGHALPLGAEALDLLEYRLEPDPQLPERAAAREAAPAGPEAVHRRRRRSAARARQASRARSQDPADGRQPGEGPRRRAARLPRVRHHGGAGRVDGLDDDADRAAGPRAHRRDAHRAHGCGQRALRRARRAGRPYSRASGWHARAA